MSDNDNVGGRRADFLAQVFVDAEKQGSYASHLDWFVCVRCSRPQPDASSVVTCFGALTYTCSAHHKLCSACGLTLSGCPVEECKGNLEPATASSWIDVPRFWKEAPVIFSLPCGTDGDICNLDYHFKNCPKCITEVNSSESNERRLAERVERLKNTPKLEKKDVLTIDLTNADSTGNQDGAGSQDVLPAPESYDVDVQRAKRKPNASSGGSSSGNVKNGKKLKPNSNRRSARRSSTSGEVQQELHDPVQVRTYSCPCGCGYDKGCPCDKGKGCTSLIDHKKKRGDSCTMSMKKVFEEHSKKRLVPKTRLLRIFLVDGNTGVDKETLHKRMKSAGYVKRDTYPVAKHWQRCSYGPVVTKSTRGVYRVHQDYVNAGRKLKGSQAIEDWFAPGALCQSGCGRRGSCLPCPELALDGPEK